MTTVVSERLWAYALFAGALSSAGVPLYLYAPKFYFDNYGVGLATLGVALVCWMWCKIHSWDACRRFFRAGVLACSAWQRLCYLRL